MDVEKQWRSPITSVVTAVKDVFIEEFRHVFDENHDQFPSLPVTEEFPDEKINWSGLVIRLGNLTITPANIGDAVWWHQIINEDLIYRSDVQLFNGSAKVTVTGRNTLVRDEIADSVMQLITFDSDFRQKIRLRGVEFEVKHVWSGDSHETMADKSDDLIHTTSTDVEISGEIFYTKNEITGVLSAIIIIPTVAPWTEDEFGNPMPPCADGYGPIPIDLNLG